MSFGTDITVYYSKGVTEKLKCVQFMKNELAHKSFCNHCHYAILISWNLFNFMQIIFNSLDALASPVRIKQWTKTKCSMKVFQQIEFLTELGVASIFYTKTTKFQLHLKKIQTNKCKCRFILHTLEMHFTPNDNHFSFSKQNIYPSWTLNCPSCND